jgi:hypothetical protein
MAQAAEVAGDIVTAGSAISGLILVYIGSLTASFATYQPTEKKAVVASYSQRAWFAFIGLVLFMIAIVLALIGKWLDVPCMIIGALVLLIVALIWVLVTAILTVLEIK